LIVNGRFSFLKLEKKSHKKCYLLKTKTLLQRQHSLNCTSTESDPDA
jgi:hypothetical protein